MRTLLKVLLNPTAGLAAVFIVLVLAILHQGGLVWGGKEPDKKPVERPRPLVGKAAEKDEGPGDVPKEDQLYVWPLPEKGTQTLLVLRVIDGDTAEVAFLVPAIVRINGINAPEADQPGGKEATEGLTKLIGGKLLPANLHGREKFGRILADFYLGKPDPKDKGAPAGWSSQWMIDQKFAKPYTGKGPRP